MIVAVIDVGSNSVRLLVADADVQDVRQRKRERVYLRLGDDAYRLGYISGRKLKATEELARAFARTAAQEGAEHLETIVTAPGRQAANADELVRVLASATQAPVMVLSAEEEGSLAWEGAVAALGEPPEVVATADLGGGSCEIAVGTPTLGPVWVRSFEAGALRVTRAYLRERRPGSKALARARAGIRELVVVHAEPPLPDLTLAVGGTARALGRVLGKSFTADELDELAARLVATGSRKIADRFGITPERSETLLGGTLVLSAVARLLDARLEVGRAGLREGAVLALARAEAAVA